MAPSKQELAYQAIRERIVDGTFGPGFRLVIDDLARELGVSSVPIREAIRRLEAEGWVTFTPNVGARVSELDVEQWVEGMHVLAVLEGYATALAAPGLGADDLRRARERNRQMREALEGGRLSDVTRLNRAFHFALYERCPNRALVRLIDETWDRVEGMRRSLSFYLARRAWTALEEHDRLVALIEEGAGEAQVERTARRHKMRTVAAYLKSEAGHDGHALAAAAGGRRR
jgi:DNA-binding GntR family transcriptional regulator